MMEGPALDVGTTGAISSQWLKVLLVLVCIDAFGWLFGVGLTLIPVYRNRALPEFAGIRLLGGPFEALGINGMILAGLMFVMVSAFKLLAAAWLSSGRKDGAVLELILLGLSAIFWYGFALPFGPPIGILQVIILALTWKSFH